MPSDFEIQKLKKAVKNNIPIIIADNKKHADILNSNECCAIPYIERNVVNTCHEDVHDYLIGASVVIICRNSKESSEFARSAQENISRYVFRFKLIHINLDKLIGDGCDIKGLLDLIRSHNWQYATWITQQKDKLKINPGLLAENIARNVRIELVGDAASDKNNIVMYGRGVYNNVSLTHLKNLVSKYIKPDFRTTSLIENVTKMLICKESLDPGQFNMDHNIINFQNGLYNLEKRELMPHDKNYLSNIQISAKYIEAANNFGYWDNFIADLTCGDQELADVLQEFMGLTISNYKGSYVKTALILYGKGNTGKSKYLEMMCYLIGKDATLNVSVQKLGDVFSLGNLEKARLLYNADLPSSKISDDSMSILKQLTGGDIISIQKKFKDLTDVVFKGVLCYTCNVLPSLTGDYGDHVFKRFTIIPCENVIPVEKRKPNLVDDLKQDAGYIINWAIKGLERLVSNNFVLTESKAAQQIKEHYMNRIDSVRGFLHENIRRTEVKADRIKTSDLYTSYKMWCARNGYDYYVSQKEFPQRLEMTDIKRSHKYNGHYYYTGITYKTVDHDHQLRRIK